jgi:hypothetical protein
MTNREVMQQTLEALENVNPSLVCEMAHHPKKDQHGIGQKCPLEIRHLETITALRKELAQPEQEPVAWQIINADGTAWFTDHSNTLQEHTRNGKEIIPLYYTAPPQRKPLTEEQIKAALTVAVQSGAVSWLGFEKDEDNRYTIPSLSPQHYQIARAVEAAHNIKEGT